MPQINLAVVARELGLSVSQVENVVALADEGNTVPFITRYRKERTGNLDEEQIRAVLERVDLRRQVADRAEAILKAIESQGKLTPALRSSIERADTMKLLEDLYLPYRPKKRTRASQARDRGLELLADTIWHQSVDLSNLLQGAAEFVDPAKEVPSAQDALQGAADILAERISEDVNVRTAARRTAWKIGRLRTAAVDESAEKAQPFRNYFDFEQPATKLPPHRILAMNRGEQEEALRVKFLWDESEPRSELARVLRLSNHKFGEFLFRCLDDALSRLIAPSLEREIRRELTEQAQAHAVQVFAKNMRSLLLQPPLAGQRVLAIDPGFRTGCKVVVLDETGKPLTTDVVNILGSAAQSSARSRITELLREHQVKLIAIGNGTACRETEELVAQVIADNFPEARYLIVNEAGASTYSTSPIAREEFPDEDATVRGTISIGRRLQDPLSELVKIEPQHIGVGLYQHDVDEKQLVQSLNQVIESCVNHVGVDLNTASVALLKHVSGLNQSTARKIVEWRLENGKFSTRAQLKKVPGIGPATFTQAAGFLKIRAGEEPLDATWIHPESYPTARKLLSKALPDDPSIGKAKGAIPPTMRERLVGVEVTSLATEFGVGVPTLQDIVDSLCRPGRDPRGDLPGPLFRHGVLKVEDLQPGMELQGTVNNVVDFGAFVDIGVKESGLVHISQLSTGYVKSPHDVVSVGDVVTVWVVSVDLARSRIALTRIQPGSVRSLPRR